MKEYTTIGGRCTIIMTVFPFLSLYRLPYSTQTIPVVLCHYLDSSKKCICGMHCFDAYLHYIAKLDLSKVSASLTSVDQSGTTSVPIELFLCSAKCLKLWK